MTTMWNLMGVVSVIAWRSNELLLHREKRVEYFQLLEMRVPEPPPLPDWRGVWEKDKLLERAAGVAESSGWIQVSVKPRILRVE